MVGRRGSVAGLERLIACLQALDLFQAVQRAQPATVSNVALWTKMADCYTEQGNVKGAVKVYTQVLKGAAPCQTAAPAPEPLELRSCYGFPRPWCCGVMHRELGWASMFCKCCLQTARSLWRAAWKPRWPWPSCIIRQASRPKRWR